MTFASTPGVTPFVKTGKLKVLAITSAKRTSGLPDIPTVAEVIPGFEATVWYGLVAPAGTPRPIIDRLNGEIAAAVKNPASGASVSRVAVFPEGRPKRVLHAGETLLVGVSVLGDDALNPIGMAQSNAEPDRRAVVSDEQHEPLHAQRYQQFLDNFLGMDIEVIRTAQEMQIPVLRYPGGNFASGYHWQDGVGAADQRRRRVNIHWGGVVEDNSFGTHEFLDFCERIGAEREAALADQRRIADAERQAKEAAEDAKDAINQAKAEVEAALADAKRQQKAVQVGRYGLNRQSDQYSIEDGCVFKFGHQSSPSMPASMPLRACAGSASGAPQNAMMASPMYLSTIPSVAMTSSVIAVKYAVTPARSSVCPEG
jgi:hypothetical protein